MGIVAANGLMFRATGNFAPRYNVLQCCSKVNFILQHPYINVSSDRELRSSSERFLVLTKVQNVVTGNFAPRYNALQGCSKVDFILRHACIGVSSDGELRFSSEGFVVLFESKLYSPLQFTVEHYRALWRGVGFSVARNIGVGVLGNGVRFRTVLRGRYVGGLLLFHLHLQLIMGRFLFEIGTEEICDHLITCVALFKAVFRKCIRVAVMLVQCEKQYSATLANLGGQSSFEMAVLTKNVSVMPMLSGAFLLQKSLRQKLPLDGIGFWKT